MPNLKANTVGKFVILILAVAICFFLLLPFLEPDTTAVPAQANPSKATPQIFTSNPLSELVRKVYAIFSRDQQRQERARQAAVQKQQLAQLTRQNTTADARYATEKTQREETSLQAGSSYAHYQDAQFMNGNGDWVLVRQTAPETAQRGMHDISSKDDAYDTYVRLDQSAQYAPTAKPVQPEIPSSGWVRIWQPIKDFFSFSKPSEKIEKTETEKPFALASAAGERESRHALDLPNTQVNAPFNVADWAAAGNNSLYPVFAILNPENTLTNVANRLRESALDILGEKDAPKAVNEINKKEKEMVALAHQYFNNQLTKDAKGATAIDIQKTISVSCGKASSLYNTSQSNSCSAGQPGGNQPENIAKAKQAALEEQQKGREEFHQFLKQNLGIDYHAKEPIHMLVLFGKTKAGKLPETANQDQMSEAERKYRFLYTAKGCDKQDCYWVGRNSLPQDTQEPVAENAVNSAGLSYWGDPNNVLVPLMDQYKKEQEQKKNKQEGQEIEENSEQTNQEKEEDQTWPFYVPYTKEDMRRVNAHNKPGHTSKGKLAKPEDPFITFSPSAKNVEDMKEVLPLLSLVIYDNPHAKEQQQILSQQNQQQAPERGQKIRERVLERMKEGSELLQLLGAQLQESGGKTIIQNSLQQAAQDLANVGQQSIMPSSTKKKKKKSTRKK